jgi:hypothetical protein
VEVLFEVLMRLVREFFDRGFFKGTVHALDLAVGPGRIRFGEARLNARLLAYTPIDRLEGTRIWLAVGELHTVVRQAGGELAFFGTDFGTVEVEGADRRGLERFLLRLVACRLRQAADTMALKATVPHRSGQVRPRGWQGLQAVSVAWDLPLTLENGFRI